MKKIDLMMQHTERVVEFIGGIGCFLLMISVCLEVVSRYIVQKVLITGLYNITESYIFPGLVFLTIAGSYRVGLWPKLEVFIDTMAYSKQRKIKIVTTAIELILYVTVAVFTLIYAYAMTLDGREFMAGSKNYPLYPMLWVVPVAFTLLSIEVLLFLGKVIKEKESVNK